MIENIIEYWKDNEYTGLDAMAEKLGIPLSELEILVRPAAEEAMERLENKWNVTPEKGRR
jgi:hypothetical protein